MPTLILSVSGARGIVGDGLDEEVALRLARAFAAVVGPGKVLIGRDSRPSGPVLALAAAMGLEQRGCWSQDLGIVPTPTVQVAVEHSDACGGVIITASHNPPRWNALKFVGRKGLFLNSEQIRPLLKAFHADQTEFPESAGGKAEGPEVSSGPTTELGKAAIGKHIDLILRTVDADRIRAAGLKVVADAVHGAGQVLWDPLFAALNVKTIWVHGEPNGELPEHPEPRRELLDPLRERVVAEGADLGLATDPDGDRCAIVLPEETVGEEGTLPLCALARLRGDRRGALVTNLSTSSRLEEVAARFDLPVLRAPVGEANVVARMLEENAIFGGEGNGGVIDPLVHLGRDAGVAAALLLELETTYGGATRAGKGGLREAWASIAPREMIKEKLTLEEESRPELWSRLRERFGVPDDDTDGLRWSWPSGWLHVRPSGTEPIIRVICESVSAAEARERAGLVRDEASAVGG